MVNFKVNGIEAPAVASNVYICDTEADVIAAETAIGAGAGIIRIRGEIAWTGVNFNGGGSYIVEGDGFKTNLITDDSTPFAVSSAESITFRNFAIDCNAFTTNKIVFNISHSHRTLFDNVSVIGDGTNGTVVQTDSGDSDFVTIQNCTFVETTKQVYHNQSDYHITINNSFGNPINCNYEGYISLYSIISDNIIDMADTVSDLVGSIQVRSGDFTVINGNVLAVATALRQKAIYLYNADQCAVFGNNIYYMLGTTQAGIYSTGNRNVIVGNHIFDIRVGWGIRLAGGNENVIVGNLILNMTGAGAILDGGFGTLVENNNI